MGSGKMNREIPSSTLATLRGILVSSLSRENLSPHDLPLHEHTRHRSPRKVHFHEEKNYKESSGGPGHGGDSMFSELCRETLRKAAVCYSSARAGSPSPSPPTSPPPSPAKEAKTAANADLANVRDADEGGRDHYYPPGATGRRVSPAGNAETKVPTSDRSAATADRSNDFREKRPAMPTDFSKRLPGLEAREGRRGTCTEFRESQSVSPEKRTRQYEDNSAGGSACSGESTGDNEWGRSDSRLSRRSPGSSPEPEDNSSTSGDEAGAASEETNQRSSSAHNRHSLTKEQTMHWFAQIGGDDGSFSLSDVKSRQSLYDEDSLDGDRPCENEGRESTGSSKELDRAKLVRERQNEERQRKLEELRQQALAAQRFREQREEERRRRIDELRSRDNDRRNQVEERKRLICEAERERREAILRKNQEREARIEAKRKNERSHIVFAFGSSTPRMLEPADTGGATFWGTRRATSTTNVMMFSAAQPLTRRSSERELDGSKKRATSAGGLDRKPGEDMRMSSSMYEVFNWNSSPDPPLTPAKHKRASLSLPPTTDIFAVDDKSDSDTRRLMIQRAASGEESDNGTPSTPSSVYLRVNRRRTDLMPTIPSPRDGPPSTARSSSSKAFTRSPGRTYSMSRLDQLAQPRKRATEQLGTLPEQRQQSQPPLQSASSMSRSMSHLAGGSKTLKRSDNSRSMGTLPGAASMPRPTRAERLRRKAREQAQQGIRSGEVTPNSPSRPHSSMSQQSASSVASSNVNLRNRTTRRPRPASIAGTGVSITEKHNLVSDVKLMKDSKPPLPKVHSTPKKPSTPKTTEVKKPTEKLIKNAKSSPRITPKATPLQSPGAEHVPLIRETNTEIIKQNESKDTQDVKLEEKNEEKKDQGSEKTQQQETNIITESISNDTKVATEFVSASKQIKDETNLMQESLSMEEPPTKAKKEENKKMTEQEKKMTETTEVKSESETDEQVDMSASMIAKIRITTEEEAKAALAERRRLAREQAEREAELERLRQEEEARLEAERLRAEEEEQRRLEEETIRLANEAREAEEQRLRLAIEEAKRREEEDRRKREEETRQKQEKEEADRRAREEAEKQRIEMAERLKKEEEERNARRKRVEAIMLRTRGKNQSNTSAKGEGGDGDKLKEDSPSDENKPVPDGKGDDVMTASLISEATQQFISSEQRAHHTENSVLAPDIVHNGTTTHRNGINESKNIAIDNNQGNGEGEVNGHHTNHGNDVNNQSITLDNATVKQNNVTNNLLDLSDFDTLSNNSSGYSTGPILELTPNLANEDTLNSNLNPAAMPFTPMSFVPAPANVNVNPFQDNFINKPQDNNQVPDLLS